MGIQAIDLSETTDYVSKFDTDKENPTVWKLGALDTRIRKMIEDISWEYVTNPNEPGDAKAKASFNIGKSEIDFVKHGIKGFSNFRQATGKEVYYNTESVNVGGKAHHVLRSDIIGIIPGNVIHELAEEIKRINEITEEERKN